VSAPAYVTAELEKVFSPEVLAALDERMRRMAREEVGARVPSRPAGEEELTVAQVAEIKNVRPKTVYEWKDMDGNEKPPESCWHQRGCKKC